MALKILNREITDFQAEFDAAVEEIKVRLGSPVIENNIADDHIGLALKDAITFFAKFSPQGTIRKYILLPITSELMETKKVDLTDILESVPVPPPEPTPDPITGEIIPVAQDPYIPEDYTGYGGLLEITDAFTTDRLPSPSIEYQSYIQQNYTPSYYGFSQSDLAVMNIHRAYFYDKLIFQYDPNTKIIAFNTKLDRIRMPYIILETYFFYSPKDLIQNNWVMRYAAALAQVYWGKIATKYKNIYLAGGIELDGRAILQQGEIEKQELLQEFRQNVRPLEPFFY